MDGIIFLDKPAGITSFQTCDFLRKRIGAEKAGHAGTLDPNVTGILIIALENSTKLMPLLEKLDKEYIGKAHLHSDVQLSKLKKTIKEKFTGKIIQIPPRKSRVKRQEREREIYNFKILKKQAKDFEFQIRCEAGTYIRKLMDDLGKAIGTGCHMIQLRRIKQGPFSIKLAKTIEKTTFEDIVEPEKIIKQISSIIHISKQAEEKLKQGKYLKTNDIEKISGKFEKNQIIAAFSKNKVVALIKPFFNSQEIKKQKSYILKPERII